MRNPRKAKDVVSTKDIVRKIRSLPLNLAGKIIGDFQYLEKRPKPSLVAGDFVWICRCIKCGEITRIDRWEFIFGIPGRCFSCMPKRKRCDAKNGSKSPEYQCWTAMKQRCQNPKDDAWPRYGGRGITVCEAWNSFEQFVKDMGSRPTMDHSVERVNNNLGYFPGNCKWATRKEQGRNTRHNRIILIGFRAMPISAWAERLGINYGTLFSRIKRWGITPALTKPVRTYSREKGEST